MRQYLSIFVLFFVILMVDCDEEVEVHDEIANNSTIGEKEMIEDIAELHEKEGDVKRAISERNEVEEEVKAELDKAVQSLKESAKEKGDEANGLISSASKSLEPCGAVDCNHRGTCLGTKKTFLCACQLGYSGSNCEETVCDSSRDCNGRGLCLGTTNQLTCLCNLGYTGKRCETPI